MRLRLAFAFLLLPLALAACGGNGNGSDTTSGATTSEATTSEATTSEATTTEPTTTNASGCAAKEQPPPKNVGNEQEPSDLLDSSRTYEVTFVTNCGSFTVELDVKTSPNTATSIYRLAENGFYDDTYFHRIVPGFVIQGGDPTGRGDGGPGYSTQDDVPADAQYVHGVVAMAKTQQEPAGTSGSQFFVVTGADVGLPPDYAILGKVTKGLDVVDRIGKLGGQDQQPTEAVVIERAEVSEK